MSAGLLSSFATTFDGATGADDADDDDGASTPPPRTGFASMVADMLLLLLLLKSEEELWELLSPSHFVMDLVIVNPIGRQRWWPSSASPVGIDC